MTGLEIAALALGGVSAAAQVVGGMQQARAAEQTAQLNRFRARQREVQGIEEGNEILRQRNRTLGANNARYAAAGIALGAGGAPEQVNDEVRRDAERQFNISRANTTIEASGMRQQARQSVLFARAARISGIAGGARNLATTATTAFG